MRSSHRRSNLQWDRNTQLQAVVTELLNGGISSRELKDSRSPGARAHNLSLTNDLIVAASRKIIGATPKETPWAEGTPIMHQLWPYDSRREGKHHVTICAAQWVTDDQYPPNFEGMEAFTKQVNGRFRRAGATGFESVQWQHDLWEVLFNDEHRDKMVDALNKVDFCQVCSWHLIGQATLDDIYEEIHKALLPPIVYGDGDPFGVNYRACVWMMLAGVFAGRLGFNDVIHGFTGSPIWKFVYDFAVPQTVIDAGYDLFAKRWHPILDVYDHLRKVFALEFHGTEIAFDLKSGQRAVAALGNRPTFGLGMDRSHFIWQGVDPVEVIRAFPERIYHAHWKSVKFERDGKCGIMRSHLPLAQTGGGWQFHTVGRGHGHNGLPEDLEREVRALNDIGYNGPFSVENEEPGSEAHERMEIAISNVRDADYTVSKKAFDSAFQVTKPA